MSRREKGKKVKKTNNQKNPPKTKSLMEKLRDYPKNRLKTAFQNSTL